MAIAVGDTLFPFSVLSFCFQLGGDPGPMAAPSADRCAKPRPPPAFLRGVAGDNRRACIATSPNVCAMASRSRPPARTICAPTCPRRRATGRTRADESNPFCPLDRALASRTSRFRNPTPSPPPVLPPPAQLRGSPTPGSLPGPPGSCRHRRAAPGATCSDRGSSWPELRSAPASG